MGNRAYITINNKTIYMHWNGGLDTWLPIAEIAFKHNKTCEDILNFLKHCGLSYEIQKDKEAREWLEENGHYYIDTTNKRFKHKKENKTVKYYTFLEDEFKEYNNAHIKEEYRDQNYKDYWLGFQEEAKKFWNITDVKQGEKKTETLSDLKNELVDHVLELEELVKTMPNKEYLKGQIDMVEMIISNYLKEE